MGKCWFQSSPQDDCVPHHVPISSSVYSTLGIGSPLSRQIRYQDGCIYLCFGSVSTHSNGLTVCIWRRCLRSFSSSACKPRPCSPVQIQDVTLWLHSLSWCILVIRTTKTIPEMRAGFHHSLLENPLLTGWSWSRSGSNFVTRWWHLSKSAIFFGNQWTRKRANGRVSAVLVLLLRNLTQNCAPEVCVKAGHALTFDFFGGFDVLRVPLEGADEGADVWQVQLAADEVLQALQAVLQLRAWTRLQMMDFCFKCLKKKKKSKV